MKTFKKLFSVSAIVALLGTLAPFYAFGATYSDELQEAYEYAYAKNVTTMTSIDNANMYGSLTRIAMAKMIANYATTVLNLEEVDNAGECTFSDVTASLDAQYDNGVTNACKLGLMGQNITAFRPSDPVTRAEFGTTLSRALNRANGNTIEEGTPYYENHLAYLKSEGIMNDISNPSATEVRGYVMLMMMRADDDYVAPSESGKCTLEERVDCILNADDTEACIAACSGKDGDQVDEPEEVKAGTLTVSMGDALADGTQIPNAGIVSFGTVNFKAASDDVNLKSVTIKKQGLVKTMTNTKVWFEENGNRVSAKVSFNSDGEAIVSFAPAYTVKANKTAKFDLYVDLTNAGLAAGTDLSFASTDVDSSAESNKGSFTTPTLRTANYTVADVQIFDTAATYTPLTCANKKATWTADIRTHIAANCNVAPAGGSVTPAALPVKSTATANGRQLAEFKIENASATEDVLFRSIQLRQEGTADLENISNVVLERNSEIVSTDYTVDGKYLTILLDNDKIEKSNNAVYTLRAKVNTVDAGDNYKFYLKNAEDLNVVEATTEFRASLYSANYGVAATTNTYGTTLTTTYTVEGGDVTFARDESLDLDQTVAAGSEVVLMQGTITTKESVTFENPTLTIASISATTTLSDLFTTLYLKIGNSVFTYTAGAENATPGTNTLAFDGTAVVNGKANVRVYGTLKNTSNGKSMKLSSLDFATFGQVYYANENPVSATSTIGTIAGNAITVEDAALSMSRTDGLGANATMSIGDGNTIYKANVVSQSTKGAKVTSISFNFDKTTPTFNLDQASTLTLYVDGTAVSTRNIATTATNVVFNGLNFTVDKNTTAEIEVRANIKEGTTAGKLIQLVGVVDGMSYVDLANNRTNTADTIDGAIMEVVIANGTITIDTDLVPAQLLVKGDKDVELAAIKVTANEGKVRLYNLQLDAAVAGQFNNISNVRLANESGDVVATATTTDANTVKFTNLSNTTLIEKDNSITYKVLVDINSNVTAGNLRATIKADANPTYYANLRDNNGAIVNGVVGNANLLANTHVVSNASLKVTKLDAAGDLNAEAMKFSVEAKGGDIYLETFDLNLVAPGYTPGSVKIYRSNVADANEVAGKVTTITVSAADTETTVTVGTVDYTINAGDGTMTIAAETDALAAALVAAGYDAVSDSTNQVTVYSEATFAATANTAVAATASKNNKVAKGTTVTFIVAYPNAVAGSTTNWNLSLRDITVDGIGSIKGFTNVVSFPFTAKNN